jgi:hypothetical protein
MVSQREDFEMMHMNSRTRLALATIGGLLAGASLVAAAAEGNANGTLTDDTAAGGPKVDVEFDTPLLRELTAAR